ncbi:MAG: YmdB family metallophosphoesterase [Campylobacteraceae bacterium]|jgi:metallophosphoesterase (TIGR00282 family)|nr:YmdB family metallophosphoesterase [Campylobacteraceae bacterium]
MKIGFIGDVVGRPGRGMIEAHLRLLRDEFGIDFVVANTENASHGFGLTIKNAHELFGMGIDAMSGGNHTWDRKELEEVLDDLPILRPYNLPLGVVGRGALVFDVKGEKLGVINLMGHFSMPMCDNPFVSVKEAVAHVKEQGAQNIFIDFHAESTSEKAALFAMLKGEISALIGTHTHVGTDDMSIDKGTLFLSDVGLSGCRDGVIGVDKEAPLKRFLTGLPAAFEIPSKCKKVFQMAIFTLEGGKCSDAFKIKIFESGERFIQKAYHEQL